MLGATGSPWQLQTVQRNTVQEQVGLAESSVKNNAGKMLMYDNVNQLISLVEEVQVCLICFVSASFLLKKMQIACL